MNNLKNEMKRKGVKQIYRVTVTTKEGNTTNAIDLGLGRLAIEVVYPDGTNKRYMTKGDWKSMVEYLQKHHGGKVLDIEALERPI